MSIIKAVIMTGKSLQLKAQTFKTTKPAKFSGLFNITFVLTKYGT